MKITGLIVGIILMVLSGLGIIGCLLAPSLTNGRASFEESMMVAIPLAVLFFIALAGTIISAILFLKRRKTV